MTTAAPPRQRSPALLAFGKLVLVPIAIVLIGWSLWGKTPSFRFEFHAHWVIAAIILIEAALWIVSVRLVHLLEIYGCTLRTSTALRINLQSVFYFLVVPTQAGMEAVRFLGLRTAIPSARRGTIASILLVDRLLGAAAAGLLFLPAAALILPDAPNLMLSQASGWKAIAVILVALVFICGAVLAARFLLRHFEDFANSVVPLRRHWFRLLLILLHAIGAQILVLASVACALRALGLDISVMPLTFGIMGGNFIMVIPLSAFGLGPAEVGSVALLMTAGVDTRTAALATFITYLTRVFAGLQGAVIELHRSRAALIELAPRKKS